VVAEMAAWATRAVRRHMVVIVAFVAALAVTVAASGHPAPAGTAAGASTGLRKVEPLPSLHRDPPAAPAPTPAPSPRPKARRPSPARVAQPVSTSAPAPAPPPAPVATPIAGPTPRPVAPQPAPPPAPKPGTPRPAAPDPAPTFDTTGGFDSSG
jgi:hypothetical protein